MHEFARRIIKPGKATLARSALRWVVRRYFQLRWAFAPTYRSPTDEELAQIERDLVANGIHCQDFAVDAAEFRRFKETAGFQHVYHGGKVGGVFNEKNLEHFVAWKLIGLERLQAAPYLDIAACASPWARLLRERGIEAFAIDLELPEPQAHLTYYRQEDATRTSFEDASIGGASLQCAYEMFVGNHDIALVHELSRIMKPGGRVVISPLYTHTHPCYYQTPDYFGRPLGDTGATGYIRRDCWGVAASRKYSVDTLQRRVWDTAIAVGLTPSLLVLRNKKEIGSDIYLHFILLLDKPDHAIH